MTRWPLVCETCGTEVHVGTLAGGECGDCHIKTVAEQITTTEETSTEQAGLGDFA